MSKKQKNKLKKQIKKLFKKLKRKVKKYQGPLIFGIFLVLYNYFGLPAKIPGVDTKTSALVLKFAQTIIPMMIAYYMTKFQVQWKKQLATYSGMFVVGSYIYKVCFQADFQVLLHNLNLF